MAKSSKHLMEWRQPCPILTLEQCFYMDVGDRRASEVFGVPVGLQVTAGLEIKMLFG